MWYTCPVSRCAHRLSSNCFEQGGIDHQIQQHGCRGRLSLSIGGHRLTPRHGEYFRDAGEASYPALPIVYDSGKLRIKKNTPITAVWAAPDVLNTSVQYTARNGRWHRVQWKLTIHLNPDLLERMRAAHRADLGRTDPVIFPLTTLSVYNNEEKVRVLMVEQDFETKRMVASNGEEPIFVLARRALKGSQGPYLQTAGFEKMKRYLSVLQ